jgi:hypothetical protein
MVTLLRKSVFNRLAGYEGNNEAERLSVDPAMRLVVGGRAREHQAASCSQTSRFETEVLAQNENLIALNKMLGMWNERLFNARRVIFKMAEVAVPREFQSILKAIGRLRLLLLASR